MADLTNATLSFPANKVGKPAVDFNPDANRAEGAENAGDGFPYIRFYSGQIQNQTPLHDVAKKSKDRPAQVGDVILMAGSRSKLLDPKEDVLFPIYCWSAHVAYTGKMGTSDYKPHAIAGSLDVLKKADLPEGCSFAMIGKAVLICCSKGGDGNWTACYVSVRTSKGTSEVLGGIVKAMDQARNMTQEDSGIPDDFAMLRVAMKPWPRAAKSDNNTWTSMKLEFESFPNDPKLFGVLVGSEEQPGLLMREDLAESAKEWLTRETVELEKLRVD